MASRIQLDDLLTEQMKIFGPSTLRFKLLVDIILGDNNDEVDSIPITLGRFYLIKPKAASNTTSSIVTVLPNGSFASAAGYTCVIRLPGCLLLGINRTRLCLF